MRLGTLFGNFCWAFSLGRGFFLLFLVSFFCWTLTQSFVARGKRGNKFRSKKKRIMRFTRGNGRRLREDNSNGSKSFEKFYRG